MNVKKYLKIAVDVLMLILLVFLANRRNGMGLLLHAVLGIAEFLLFVIHHLLNVWWYKSLFKGKWNARWIFLFVTDTVMMVAMILMIISSFQISGLVFEWDFFPVRFQWKNIHSVCSSALFMITAFHLAIHMNGVLKKMELIFQKSASHGRKFKLLSITYYLLTAIGTIALSQSRIFSNLFLLYTDASYRWSDFMQIVFSVMIVLGVISGCTLVRKLKQQPNAKDRV